MKKIAVLTSGGDAPGMNAAVKGVVRTALNNGFEIFGVRDAYKGLVQGGDAIFPLDWDDVGLFFREGGTFLGSARYARIKGDSNEALKLKDKILKNLQNLGISGLIVIGGDGSLTGAYELYSYLKEKENLLPGLKDMNLSVVGIPGSIDNDIAFTDMSIGADTTLNTIIECIDKLRDTAASHKRVIIVEVMGRLQDPFLFQILRVVDHPGVESLQFRKNPFFFHCIRQPDDHIRRIDAGDFVEIE